MLSLGRVKKATPQSSIQIWSNTNLCGKGLLDGMSLQTMSQEHITRHGGVLGRQREVELEDSLAGQFSLIGQSQIISEVVSKN